MIEDEVRQLLRELVQATGAESAMIVHGEPDPAAAVNAPLGGGSFLVVGRGELAAGEFSHGAAVERCARALRACARRWDVRLPALSSPDSARSPKEALVGRIQVFLEALCRALSMDNAVVMLRDRVVVSAFPLEELERAQLPFTARRVAAEAARQTGSSHAELYGDDFYATTFWYGGCLIGFFSRPYALDFVRQRAKQVTRELAHLLSLLDEPDHDPAKSQPPPE